MHLLSAEATAALSEATRLELARWCPRPNCSASTVSCLLDPDPEAASVHVRFCSNASWVRSYRDPSGWRLVEAPFVASRTPLSELAPGRMGRRSRAAGLHGGLTSRWCGRLDFVQWRSADG